MQVSTDSTARALQTLFGPGTTVGLTDGQLLERFSTQPGDAAESAFAALVERHGPMVLRACRAVLRDEHDARDAFQATFLILARKGPRLWLRDSLAPWLYRVARRAALRLASQSGRRRDAERRAAIAPGASSHDDLNRDTERILHEEVDRLPERFRRAIILCDLDGRTHDEAARSLGCPIGTIKSRLARGRDRLRLQLTRRGLAPAVGLPSLLKIPPARVGSTVRFVIDSTSGGPTAAVGGAATLAGVTMGGMFMDQIKVAATFVLGLGLATAGYGLLARAAADPPPPRDPAVNADASPPPGPAPLPPKTADSPKPEAAVKKTNRPVLMMNGRTQAWAYDPKNQKWRTYRSPNSAGLKLWGGGSIATAQPASGPIAELAAFSAESGAWARQVLIEPSAYDNPSPITTSNDYAYVHYGRYLYVFVARSGRWHHVKLTDGQELSAARDRTSPIAHSGQNCVLYQLQGRLVAFSVETETWDSLELDRKSGPDSILNIALPSPDNIVYCMNGDRLFAYEPKVGKFREIRPDEG